MKINPRKKHELVEAGKELVECGGGFICTENDAVVAKLELPIFGLMSPLGLKQIANEYKDFINTAKSLANDDKINPFMGATLISLPCKPFAAIADKGLFSLKELKILPLFVE